MGAAINPSGINKLPRQAKAQLLSLLEERESRVAQKLFFHLFPDEDTVWTGPTLMGGLVEPGQILYARDKYQAHLEFFREGAIYRERCLMAGNRCITPWTYIETPSGEALSAEVWTSKDARVLSLDGESQCAVQSRDGLFLGIEPAFRVVLDNGRFFDCSRKHRVLSCAGWVSLDQLMSLSSGLRCWYKRQDYQASCVSGGYLGDQPLRSAAGIDLTSPQQQGGAQARAPLVYEHTDAVERILQYIRACPQPFRLSTPDDLRRFSGLFGLFSGASTSQPFLSLNESSLTLAQLAQSLSPHLLSGGVYHPCLFSGDEPLSAGQTVSRDESYRQTMLGAKHLSFLQWCDVQYLGGSVQELFRGAEHISIFYPSVHPLLVGGQKITAIVPLGLQPIIDSHVPVTNNYYAAGVIHHNTGKTFSGGGYEVACHLTGLYPPWWEGRRFAHPVSVWAAGDTYMTTRDIIQVTLLGEVSARGARKTMDGRGVIPGRLLGDPTWHSGVQNTVDTISVKHVSGGQSVLGLKSYDQGRKAFQGTGRHIIWFDEEPPEDVYNEALIRTATLNGITMLTFTPLSGLSKVVLSFLPQEMRPQTDDLMSGLTTNS